MVKSVQVPLRLIYFQFRQKMLNILDTQDDHHLMMSGSISQWLVIITKLKVLKSPRQGREAEPTISYGYFTLHFLWGHFILSAQQPLYPECKCTKLTDPASVVCFRGFKLNWHMKILQLEFTGFWVDWGTDTAWQQPEKIFLRAFIKSIKRFIGYSWVIAKATAGWCQA